MTVSMIQPKSLYKPAIIYSKEILSPDICKILIDPGNTVAYQPGQYINLRSKNTGLARSYSLVSHPDDYFLEIHVRKMPGGKLSSWIFNELEAGDEIEYQGTMGNSYYKQVKKTDASILLVGKGTGIAPLYGILLDALKNLHQGDIIVIHEGKYSADLYLHDKLLSLEKQHRNIKYISCVEGLNKNKISPYTALTLLESSADELLPNITSSYLFTSGSPEFVSSTKTLLKHHNINKKHIYSDSFDYKNLREAPHKKTADLGRRKSDSVNINQQSTARQIQSCDNEMWHALEQGKKLKLILDDFYQQVYQDERLSGFFQNSTMKRSSEKQYLFMRQLFTGEKVYFGDRPKNAHHWMVISDELFDYRETLMRNCLQKHGLAEHLINRWINLDENFRSHIVKHTPFPKIVNGIEMPLDGYESLKIDEGTLCDGCHKAINKGEMVRYHLRLGLTYCENCMENELSEQAI